MFKIYAWTMEKVDTWRIGYLIIYHTLFFDKINSSLKIFSFTKTLKSYHSCLFKFRLTFNFTIVIHINKTKFIFYLKRCFHNYRLENTRKKSWCKSTETAIFKRFKAVCVAHYYWNQCEKR